MLLMLFAALAMPLPQKSDGPRPRGSPNDWVSDNDFPPGSVMKGQFGPVHFKLDVDDIGVATACHILNSSGFWALDNRTCALMLQRARFEPGHAGGYRSTFLWHDTSVPLDDSTAVVKRLWEPVAAKVTVKALPANYSGPPLVRVHFGAKGPSECRVELTSGNAAIDGIACQQALTLPDRAEALALGGPRLDTRMYLIEFTVG